MSRFFCNMSLLFILASSLFFINQLGTIHAQTCASETILSVTYTDLNDKNSAFTSSITRDGDIVVGSTSTALTTTASESYGGFFFTAPTDFQGPGGFSVKFILQATDTGASVGDAWEFIVAGSSNLDIVSPPYTSGSTNNGLSGWTRLNAFVVEFDTLNSGSDHEDDSTNHVAGYLAGTEVCSQDLAVSLASTAKYTVWVDYNGFSTSAQIRISDANSETRPDDATLDCNVDIWGTLDISASNHIGFMAYNPTGGGAEHSMVDVLSVADAYRPFDSSDCAAYANCAQRTGTDNLCLTSADSTTCTLSSCAAGYVWDVSGTECCAFIEKGTWALADSAGSGPFSDGDTVDCEEVRRTIAFPVDASNCSA